MPLRSSSAGSRFFCSGWEGTLGPIKEVRRSALRRGVKRIVLRRLRGILRRIFRARNIQVDDDRLLTAAYDHGLYRLIFAGVQFLMRHVGRDVDEVSRTRFIDELQVISPTKTGSAADYVDHRFQFAVMMRTGLGVGMHDDGSRPELLRADAGARDGFGAGHARRLRRVAVEFAAANDAQAVSFPVGHFVSSKSIERESLMGQARVYQTSHRFPSGRTMAAPALQLQAF